MKNYLLYPDCYSEESINRCRFALLKLLGLYNLRPPANIRVIIHTNKVASFEMFEPFFRHMQLIDSAAPRQWQQIADLQKLLAAYEGNVLVSHTNGYFKKPLDELFTRMTSGSVLYALQSGANDNRKSTDSFLQQVFVAGLPENKRHEPAADLLKTAEESEAYVTKYKPRKEVHLLLKTFFLRNEEESMANLVKKARAIDLEAVEKEAAATDSLPFYKKWMAQLRGKKPVLRRHLNKL